MACSPKGDVEILRALWIDALRNGNHKQCRHHMAQGDARCALGVLNDIVERSFTLQGSFRDMCDKICAPATTSQVVRMNDELGYTFAQIADVLENVPATYLERWEPVSAFNPMPVQTNKFFLNIIA